MDRMDRMGRKIRSGDCRAPIGENIHASPIISHLLLILSNTLPAPVLKGTSGYGFSHCSNQTIAASRESWFTLWPVLFWTRSTNFSSALCPA